MARVIYSPLIADIRGKTADVVFSSWKGRAYIRQRVIPANPQSAGQTAVRNSLAECVALWQAMSVTLNDAYGAGADELTISGYNDFVGRNRAHVQALDGLWGPRRDLDADDPRLQTPTDFVDQGTPAGGQRGWQWTDPGQGADYHAGYLLYDSSNNVLFEEDLDKVLMSNEEFRIYNLIEADVYLITAFVHRLSDGQMVHWGSNAWTQPAPP